MKQKYLIASLVLFIFIISCSKKTQIGNATSPELSELDNDDFAQEIKKFQEELNTEYLDPEESPLSGSQIKEFEKKGGHQFFITDPKYKVLASLDRSQTEKDLGFKTTTPRIAMYDKIGVAKFTIDSKAYELSIYESHYLRSKEEYKDYLFLPYTDLTNGNTSYGGGRYVDLKRQDGDEIIIDFNKSYNPYCAYSSKYSCPIPPLENFLDIEIKAGIKYESK